MEMYPDLFICELDEIKHDQQLLQDTIDSWKKDNCRVLIHLLNDFEHYRAPMEHIRSQYEKFAFTTAGLHKENNHISNVDHLTMSFCGNTQPLMDHEQKKKYNFVFLVGKTHPHRMHLLESLALKGVLDKTLLSLRNPGHAYAHLLPVHSILPEEYEWPEILNLGTFKAGWHSKDHPMAVAHAKNIGRVHPKLYTDTAYSIVSETNVYNDINYITEKTWTPMIAEHVIIGHGNKGNNHFLEQLGFVMFNDFIPNYDESDHNMVANICQHLMQESITSVYKQTKKQRRHNREHAMDERHWINYHSHQLKSYFK